jgi:hypothetical protein
MDVIYMTTKQALWLFLLLDKSWKCKNRQKPYQPMGFGLVFHPDFLLGTTLGKRIDEYQFFDYETHEALHLSEDERSMIQSSFQKIQFELNQPIDKHSKKLIAANIELFLDYCQRFMIANLLLGTILTKDS